MKYEILHINEKKGLLFLLMLILILFINSCKIDTSTKSTPEELYKILIFDTIPNCVYNIEGGGLHYSGYSIYLKFNIDTNFIDMIKAAGYKETKDSSIILNFEPPNDKLLSKNRFDSYFKNGWNPLNLTKRICFELKSKKNQWSNFGDSYLIYDIDNKLVYFFGIGT